jgi:hypothetical protein
MAAPKYLGLAKFLRMMFFEDAASVGAANTVAHEMSETKAKVNDLDDILESLEPDWLASNALLSLLYRDLAS